MRRFMKTLVTTFCAGLVMSGGLFISNPVVMAFDGVAINSNNFPDSSFREYVLDECDTNGDEVLSQAEIDATKQIYVVYKDIESLKGIEYFTSLTDLDCK